MTLFTSTDFASASGSGSDWRDTSKNVLEQLVSAKGSSGDFNFGFIYISDHLAGDTTSIFNLFKSVLKIDNWIGSVGMGVIGCGESYVNMPAISVMIGRFPENSFCIFPDQENGTSEEIPQDKVKDWLLKNPLMLSIVHGDPISDTDPQVMLRDLDNMTDSFIIGGLTSSRAEHYQIANSVCSGTLSGVFFSEDIPVATTLSQGCNPISKYYTVTKSDGSHILELDNKRALDVFQDALQEFAKEKLGGKAEAFTINIEKSDTDEYLPDEYKRLFKGQVHIALPISQSDQNDFMVRNIKNIDMDEGSIAISDDIEVGNNIMFVERNDQTVPSDLSHVLVKLRKRIQSERGCFEPKAALYISCIVRGFNKAKKGEDEEMSLIQDIIGDIPLTGFYAGGEINNARLYGYTGVLALFF